MTDGRFSANISRTRDVVQPSELVFERKRFSTVLTLTLSRLPAASISRYEPFHQQQGQPNLVTGKSSNKTSVSEEMASLHDLPVEIVLKILEQLVHGDQDPDKHSAVAILSFAQTSHQIWSMMNAQGPKIIGFAVARRVDRFEALTRLHQYFNVPLFDALCLWTKQKGNFEDVHAEQEYADQFVDCYLKDNGVREGDLLFQDERALMMLARSFVALRHATHMMDHDDAGV